jgi:ABC-type dipeptide/oligopeptide/nickel transport system ATPase component
MQKSINKILLDVKELTVSFSTESGEKKVVDNISFQLFEGEILAIVGESGSGKSVSCSSLVKLLPDSAVINAKHITLSNRDISKLSDKQLRSIRGGKVAYIFQEPGASLNPVMKISAQIIEAIKLHQPEIKKQKEYAVKLLEEVGIKRAKDIANSYPHLLSGGMQQRVMIAMALACKPDILVADEPTTALDVTIQKQIIELLKALRLQNKMSILFISHDLGVVKQIADRVIVMNKGKIVETGKTDNIIYSPKHEYTKSLIESIPKFSKERK